MGIMLILMGTIVGVSVVGAIVWSIYHIASGKFHVQYEVARPTPKKNKEAGTTSSN